MNMSKPVPGGTPATFEITTEPCWPYDKAVPRYKFTSAGMGPNLTGLLSALTPRTSTRTDLTGREALRQIIWRLEGAQVRLTRRSDPRFGDYRYVWFHQSELAAWSVLSEDQVKRSVPALTEGGVIYTVRANQAEPLSYRLTDEAFALAHAIQYPMTKADWLMHLCRSAGQGVGQESIAAYEAITKSFRKELGGHLADLRPMFDAWHKTKDPTLRRAQTTELIAAWDNRFGSAFAEIRPTSTG